MKDKIIQKEPTGKKKPVIPGKVNDEMQSLIDKILPSYATVKNNLLSADQEAKLQPLYIGYEQLKSKLVELIKSSKYGKEAMSHLKLCTTTDFNSKSRPLEKKTYVGEYYDGELKRIVFIYPTLEDIEEYSLDFESFKQAYEKTWFLEYCSGKTIYQFLAKYISEFEEICEEPVETEETDTEENDDSHMTTYEIAEDGSLEEVIEKATPEEIESDFINIKSGSATINYSTGNATLVFTTDVLTAIKLMMKMKREQV